MHPQANTAHADASLRLGGRIALRREDEGFKIVMHLEFKKSANTN
jgi:hypothetical protein